MGGWEEGRSVVGALGYIVEHIRLTSLFKSVYQES